MPKLRRTAPLVVGIALMLALGSVAFVLSVSANRRAQQIHTQDRVTLQDTLAGLTNQYVRFALKEAFDFASSAPLSLRAGDPSDRALLAGFVRKSALLNHGAALAGLVGEPLNRSANAPGLPAANDPGFAPMISELLHRRPGISSVMLVGRVPVVALAVPVVRSTVPRAIFVAFFRADRSPLQTYNTKLRYGRTGRSYLLDSAGGVISSENPADIGRPFPGEPVLRALQTGSEGFVHYMADGKHMVASYAPVGIGGWGSVIVQRSDEFFGPIAAGGFRVGVALLALLFVAAAGFVAMNHKRQMALRKAYEYKGELLANTTHELKTPLTAIRGAALTLGTRWRTMEPEQVDAFLSIIHRRSDGLGKLIERVLIGARLDAGRELRFETSPVRIAGAVDQIVADFGDASPRHSFAVSVPADLWATADPDAFEQTLGLLLENAIKYSPDGGAVSIDARVAGAMVEVLVRDHGIGISSEDVGHIFEPYYKASRGDAQRFAGVGLGLAIARRLTLEQGGDMRVTSEPGAGSVFSFSLPRCDPPQVEPAQRLVDVR